jgi:L-seryl-tRNA(Ser) seleniumtransferase
MVRNRPGKLDRVSDNPYRGLPSVDVLAARVDSRLPQPIVVDLARLAIEEAREAISAGGSADPDAAAARLARLLERSTGIGVINATGVLLHTNLGRAPWSERAIGRAVQAASGYSNLEIDVATGERGRRGSYVERLLTRLTGAEAAMVVNNNASGLLIALAATSKGRSVPVARGELIEIGGSYRLPDVMEASGAKLVEVGTTNRTRPGDFLTAIQLHTCGALLKVHPSNYRVEGFILEATVEDLAALAAENGMPLIYDIGSGLLDTNAPWLPQWLRNEPGAKQAIDAGANLVTFSGDKLLGGPQAGILVGDAKLIGLIRSHPLARALRVDGVTLAALAATLEEHMEGPPENIPFWRHALLSESELGNRVSALAAVIGAEVEPGNSRVGAGSAPGIAIPSPLARLRTRQDVYELLLEADRPVLARRDSGDLVVDLRAVEPDDDSEVAEAISRCLL